ncbi:MAG: hypothetical protein FD180_2942 [Planctomycetota bacterium]|nr:MAG: hypothetical protein FD180_2942 [Planctomycetota bacterium]
MPPASRRVPGSQGSPSTRRLGAPAAPASSRRMHAPQSGSSRSLQRGGAPDPQQNPRGGPPGKKDNTPMVVGGVAAGLLLLVGIGFAMMSGDDKPKKKEEPKAAPKVEAPKPPEYDPWKDPSMMGSETEAAKRRKEGNKDQNKSGEVDRPKEGGK